MKLNDLITFIKADLNRYDNVTCKNFIRYYAFTPGFKYSTKFRIYTYFANKRYIKILEPYFIWRLKRLTYKYGIQIPLSTRIGKGLLIRHFGGIFINPDAIIGENFTISQGCTVGINKGGTPVICDNVTLAPGSKVAGDIVIGENSIIGFNTVVTKNVPKNSRCVGSTFRII